ncbi:hypothetical protein EUV02_03925 [Polymorphobacter arshaanensis]|uniref:DUF5681 domain-containing protein n=1 Tax=Glacieibacterium arshaanense TaxID=2511025 RepID=A0A4Y9ESI5_9SPHN|nr:hypothetical protein [Polymorphobacter arshaanensis]TFU06169.1 hypothetical protein EUV02_03925 [Polymorphobacter arshaanensis]
MPTKRTGNPRGRPPGVKNKPKTVVLFALEALKEPRVAPVVVKPKRRQGNYRNQYTDMSPEERSAAQKANAAKRTPESFKNCGRKPGVPYHLTAKQHAIVLQEARPEVKIIMSKMKKQGILPEDTRAVQALETALTVMKSQTADANKIAAARLILDFTKSKPVAIKEVTVRTAEDILDELLDDDDEATDNE